MSAERSADLVDGALRVVGDDGHGVAVEERRPAAGRLDHQRDARVDPLHGAEHVPRPVLGGVRLVEVEEQEVESVPRHQPAADVPAVPVDGAAEVPGRAGVVGCEQLAEEVPARTVDGVDDPQPPGQLARRRPRDRVAHPAAADVAVDRGGHQAGVLERLEQRLDGVRHVHEVEVDEHVLDHLPGALGERRREGRPVLDEPPLVAVVPGHAGDARARRVRAGDQRGQADRRQRRKCRHAGVGTRPQRLEAFDRRRRPGGDRAIEELRARDRR